MQLIGLHSRESIQCVVNSPIGKGGEAKVYTVAHKPHLVAKCYHNPSPNIRQKLETMLASPPHDPGKAQGHVSIAWPLDSLQAGNGQVVGCLIPRIHQAQPLTLIYHPGARKKNFPGFTYHCLLRTAANLCTAVAALHQGGYIIGDLNESNVLIQSNTLVSIIDTDSFQVGPHLCTVGRPEYLPPELQQANLATTIRESGSDCFSLAVLLHLLLMNGVHPFAGQNNPGSPADCIQQGLSPYAKGGPRIPSYALPLDFLPDSLKNMFVAAFVDGLKEPSRRPTASLWAQELLYSEQHLVTCKQNPTHAYFDHQNTCIWCWREQQRVKAKASSMQQKPLVQWQNVFQARTNAPAAPARAAHTAPAPPPRLRHKAFLLARRIVPVTLVIILLFLIQGWKAQKAQQTPIHSAAASPHETRNKGHNEFHETGSQMVNRILDGRKR